MSCRCSCGWPVHTDHAVTFTCPKCKATIECDGGPMPPVKRVPPVLNKKKWPIWAKAVSRCRHSDDTGLGDTVQRILSKVGGEEFKKVSTDLGIPCRCGDRQKAWNELYPYVNEIVFVTSVSPRGQERQQQAIQSWKRFGATVISVNTSNEISDAYPVDHWFENNVEVEWSDRKTQPIWVLANVATQLDRPVFIINSDIEVFGDTSSLPMPDGRVVLGIRWNYDDDRSKASEFQWGFDVIGLTPDHARRLPADFPFGIGQPVWDYAAPLMMSGKFRVVHEPLFYHKNHTLNWSPEAWKQGASHFERLIGQPIDYGLTAKWRQQFEPDMTYDEGKGRYVRRTDCAVV